ncbi:MAG: hypothetical protein JWO02_2453 [Solirubrobacterales bacterium]|nr:hypothetical protein [Solirubrobacterales bacterium]
MVSIGKRVAGIGAAVAMIAAAGPVAVAGAATVPVAAPAAMVSPVMSSVGPFRPFGPISAADQAGADAAIGGWNAGADAAVGGLNAGAVALGLPFQLNVNTSGPLGLHTAGVAPLSAP